ncbi:MAG: patatin-like phospholipase family protein [Alphaproteobacteria bacterium]|nr:patatin-like phospholipase family protein [Alphaproteobacteria bacterium]
MQNIAILSKLRGLWRSGARNTDNPASSFGGAALIPFARARCERPVALALQGGGAHGAFTWGVLDRLLEEPSWRIEALSGASAGAINAVVLASGYTLGGAEKARAQLQDFWRTLAMVARLSPLRPTALEAVAFGPHVELSLSFMMRDMISRVVSPYQFNPLDLNPLREILNKFVDFDALRRANSIRLFIAATNAESGAARIFTNEELSPDVLLASACLPSVSQAVKIDDAYYWDGGYSSNPPLLPLIEGCAARDVVVVRLNPSGEHGMPVTAPKIQTRLNRIVFDAPLKRELDELERLRRMAAENSAHRSGFGRRVTDVRVHMISEDTLMHDVGGASQMHPDEKLIEMLHREGRASCERWLSGATDAPVLGASGTVRNVAPKSMRQRMVQAFL